MIMTQFQHWSTKLAPAEEDPCVQRAKSENRNNWILIECEDILDRCAVKRTYALGAT